MRRSHPFLLAFCRQEGAQSLYNLFQSHNYQGGTGKFTYKAFILAGQQKVLYHQNYLCLLHKQLCILKFAQNTQPFIIAIANYIVSQLASYIVPPELPPSQLGTSLLCFYFYPLCYAAVLLNSPIMLKNKSSRIQFCIAVHYMQQTILYRLFYQSVLIKAPVCSII